MKLHPWTTACTPWSLRTPRQAWWNEHDEGGKGQGPQQEEATQHFIGVSPAQSSLGPVPPPRWAWSVRCQKDRPSKREYLCLYLYLYLMNAMLKATTCSLTAPYEDRRDIVRGCLAQLQTRRAFGFSPQVFLPRELVNHYRLRCSLGRFFKPKKVQK